MLRNLARKEVRRSESSLPLRVFQVEPFCAAAEPSESSSRSRAEPRTEQARLLLPIANRHLRDHRRQQQQQQLQKLRLQERPARGEEGEEQGKRGRGGQPGREEEQCASGGRVGFLRPGERQRNGDGGAMRWCY